MNFDYPTEDPRLSGPDRTIWEEDHPVTEWMESSGIEEILYSLLYGDPLKAKAELDAAIDALVTGTAPDQPQIARLKKRKLRLRDEISQLEDQMIPDIIA